MGDVNAQVEFKNSTHPLSDKGRDNSNPPEASTDVAGILTQTLKKQNFAYSDAGVHVSLFSSSVGPIEFISMQSNTNYRNPVLPKRAIF